MLTELRFGWCLLVIFLAFGAGMHTLDLLPAFAGHTRDWKDYRATAYDAHPSPEAHTIAAEALKDEQIRSDWFEVMLSK